MEPLKWCEALSTVYQGRATEIKGNRKGGKEQQELLYLLLVGRALLGEYSRRSMKICCFPEKQSEEHMAGSS